MQGEIKIRRMRKEDIPRASHIERLSFPNPWSSNIFSVELEKEDFAFYYVMEYQHSLVAYGGYWKIGNLPLEEMEKIENKIKLFLELI